jgi:hypothetical protein
VASKKKNWREVRYASGGESIQVRALETMNVLTNMTTLLATTEARAMIFKPRKTLRIM